MAKQPGLNTWLHRTTKQFRSQVSSGEMERSFPAEIFHDASGEPTSNANWIHAPDLSAVTGFQPKYWIITGDVVTLMDQAARDTVDAVELQARRDAEVAQLDQVEDVLRAFMLVVMDEVNLLRQQHALPDRTVAQLRMAIRNKLGS